MLMASAAGATVLAPHRAVYDLSLDPEHMQLSDDAGDISGRMVFEFTGNACEGYNVSFRFVMQRTDSEGQTSVTDLRSTTHEKADGSAFDFLSQTYTNQVLTEDVKGSANIGDKDLGVKLVSPAPESISFSRSVIFPTRHLNLIIEKAQNGGGIFEQDIFDGSEGGTKVYRTTTIIGKQLPAAAEPREASIGKIRRWPVTVSYFPLNAGEDQTPDYTISFDLWENGVSTNLTMDYGDFALAGRLANYEALPQTDCK
jgi:EipB-like